jgi:hypothetical protein
MVTHGADSILCDMMSTLATEGTYSGPTDALISGDLIFGEEQETPFESLNDQLPGYSPWVGIRTASVLGGLLTLFIIYLCCNSRSSRQKLRNLFVYMSSLLSLISSGSKHVAEGRRRADFECNDVEQTTMKFEWRDDCIQRTHFELEVVADDGMTRTPNSESVQADQSPCVPAAHCADSGEAAAPVDRSRAIQKNILS